MSVREPTVEVQARVFGSIGLMVVHSQSLSS